MQRPCPVHGGKRAHLPWLLMPPLPERDRPRRLCRRALRQLFEYRQEWRKKCRGNASRHTLEPREASTRSSRVPSGAVFWCQLVRRAESLASAFLPSLGLPFSLSCQTALPAESEVEIVPQLLIGFPP